MYEEGLIASPGPDAAAVWYLRAASNESGSSRKIWRSITEKIA